jgi:putative membrane protein
MTVLSLVRSVTPWFAVVAVVAIIVASIVSWSFEFLFAEIPVLAWAGSFLWNRLVSEMNFEATVTDQGLRLRHGLLETVSQTLPNGRVQAARAKQSLLWRKPDWWRVTVNVAGYGQADTQKYTVLLPVGTGYEVESALSVVLPELTGHTDREAMATAFAPGVKGDPIPEGFTRAPRSARWLDPLSWRRRGYGVTDGALVIRSGFFSREVTVVPHARVQALGIEQGPVQRRLGLASVAVYSTNGPFRPRVEHLSYADAVQLVSAEAERSHTARQAAHAARPQPN